MKRTITALLIALSLSTAACTTAVVVRPPRVEAVWIPAHYEHIGFHRVWVGGHWRY
jgi:hypothetical protein